MWFKVQGSRFKVQKGKQIEEASNLLVIAKTGVLSCKRREAHQQEFKKYIKSMTTLTFLMSMSEHLRLLPPRARQEVARLAATTSAAVRVQEIQHEQLFSLWQLWRIEGRRHNISICYMHLVSSHTVCYTNEKGGPEKKENGEKHFRSNETGSFDLLLKIERALICPFLGSCIVDCA